MITRAKISAMRASRVRRLFEGSAYSRAALTNCFVPDAALIRVSNGNRTEWSPIWSVIIRVITKSDDREARIRFVYHEYDYRPNWTTRSPITN